MESYGTIDERSAATPKKLVGRRIIAAVAAVALVVGASAAVSVNRRPGANLRRRRLPPDRVHRERWHHVPG